MITFKNNNLYYYDFKIFNGEMSYLLIPVAISIILFNKNLLKYFSNAFLIIFCCGMLDSYILAKQYRLPLIFYVNLVFHSFGLYPLIDFKKYFKPNLINYLVGAFILFIISYLPYWPYRVNRNIFKLIVIIIYLFTSAAYYMFKN